MEEFTFTALGTEWCIVVSGKPFRDETKRAIVEATAQFERRFSRFLPGSEVNAFREAKSGNYPISPEFALLLRKADRLRVLTGGVYDPAVGGLIERAGYGPKDKIEASRSVDEFVLPRWSLVQDSLTLDGPVVFDLGGMGKGYWIDRVGDILRSAQYEHFLVDGGGDMVGTEKEGGEGWTIALEYPGKPEVAAGMLALKNQGLAVSDTFRRRFGKWHHIVDPQGKKAIETVLGAAATAPTAWEADSMTSGLFLSSRERYAALASEFRAEYLVFRQDGTVEKSPGWSGELFVGNIDAG